MKKIVRVVILLPILLALLVSCGSVRTVDVVKTKYVPMKLDLQDSIDRLYDTRPSLEPDLPENPSVSVTLVAYKDFGEDWMDYSFRLEDYINYLRVTLAEEEN